MITRQGLCSNWLERRCEAYLSSSRILAVPVTVSVFLRPTKDFLLPGTLEAPLVLIGPGTGVAPFIGFLEHRFQRTQRNLHDRTCVCTGTWWSGIDVALCDTSVKVDARGDVLLFTGNRHVETEFLFRAELHEYVRNGTLSQLYTAFSRDQQDKVYVQHRLREVGPLIVDIILHKGGYVFVCGDGAKMAKDVKETVHELLQAHAGLSVAEADAKLTELRQRHKYVEDIWS